MSLSHPENFLAAPENPPVLALGTFYAISCLRPEGALLSDFEAFEHNIADERLHIPINFFTFPETGPFCPKWAEGTPPSLRP